MRSGLSLRYATFWLAAIAIVGAIAGCDSSDPNVRISGKLLYSGNSAPGATARISVFEQRENGGDKRIVAERSLHDIGGSSVGFELHVARDLLDTEGRYGVRAEILDADGAVVAQTRRATHIKPLEQPTRVSLKLAPASKRDAALSFKRYRCSDGFHLVAATDAYEAVVRLGNRRLVLRRSANSGKDRVYTDKHGNQLAIGDRAVSFSVDGEEHARCAAASANPSTDSASRVGAGQALALGPPGFSG